MFYQPFVYFSRIPPVELELSDYLNCFIRLSTETGFCPVHMKLQINLAMISGDRLTDSTLQQSIRYQVQTIYGIKLICTRQTESQLSGQFLTSEGLHEELLERGIQPGSIKYWVRNICGHADAMRCHRDYVSVVHSFYIQNFLVVFHK